MIPVVDPGKLRHAVKLEMPVRQRNAMGEETDVWATLAEVRAAVEPVSGKELFQAAQVQALVTHRVTLRWLSGFDVKGRVIHGGRVLNPVFVRDLEERHEWLEIICLEQAG